MNKKIEEMRIILSKADEIELQKCKDNPCYFYNKYVRNKDEKELTEDEYKELVEKRDIERNTPTKRIYPYNVYPADYDDCIPAHLIPKDDI